MKSLALQMMKPVLALLIGGILAAGPVLADKPAWAGGGKGDKEDRSDRRDDRRSARADVRANERRDHDAESPGDRGGRASGKQGHFEDRHRVIVRDYYVDQFRGGRCPPGLAKKRNGCLPPGQAKKWQLGAPLPRDVVYYEVPSALVVQIGPPPSGHRYVRVSADILMIAIATGIIVDAIQDLDR